MTTQGLTAQRIFLRNLEKIDRRLRKPKTEITKNSCEALWALRQALLDGDPVDDLNDCLRAIDRNGKP